MCEERFQELGFTAVSDYNAAEFLADCKHELGYLRVDKDDDEYSCNNPPRGKCGPSTSVELLRRHARLVTHDF